MPSEPAPAAVPARRRWPWAVGVVLAAGLVLAAAAIAWLAYTNPGLQLIQRAANAAAPAALKLQGAHGTIGSGFGFERVHFDDGTTTVIIEGLRARLIGIGIRQWRFDFDELSAERVYVRDRPGAGGSGAPPLSIASPVEVSAQRLTIAQFELDVGPDQQVTQLRARALAAVARAGPDGYEVRDGRFEFGSPRTPLRAALDGRLGGATPFGIDARATLAAQVGDQPVQVVLEATGSLVQLDVDAAVSGGGADGTLQARIASFEAQELKALAADLKSIDPALWVAGAPSARLDVKADLVPVEGPQFTLRGPVSIVNALPGPLDRDRIPASAARARVELSAEGLRATELVASIGAGRVRGSYEQSFVNADRWNAAVTAEAVDPALLHTRVRPMQLHGALRAASRDGTTRLTGDLRNAVAPSAQARIDLHVTAARLVIDDALIELGSGSARISGEVGFAGTQPITVAGDVQRFDPGLLIDGLDARVSGRFRLDGELSPQPHGRVEFELVDSRLLGRPLAGSGRASLQQDQSLQVDATLAVRSARIIARGSLGQPGSVLTVSADVPSLLELALPVDGALALEATLRGTLPRPAVDAHIDLRRLRYETHRVEQAQAVLNYGGGDDGTLAVRATATDHRFGANRPLSLQSATVSIDGRLGEHTVRVDAVNLDTEPLALAARGGWRDARWIGAITSAAVGRPLNLRLLEELALSTNFSDLRVGPGRFELVGAIVEQFRIDADGQSLSTSGRFGNLRPTELVMSSTPTILPATPRSPLTLRGEWDLRFGVQADGHLRIERAEGDLYTGATGGPIGVRELRLEAALRANRLTATAILRGDAGGRLDASLQADTERAPGVGWRLAQQRPLSFRTQAILPSVDWINALLSERIRANVRLAGSLAANVTIEGTPAQPRATGGITGAALRVAWIEQGVRLENGVLIARVEDDAIILDELRFSGPPRVQPADRRAARAAGGEPGFVTLNGRLSLRDLKGVLQVAAERLPLLQRTDRWVMATGGANIILSERRVEVNGAAVAVAGFIDFSRPDLPSLPDDVSVVRPGDAPSGRIAEPQVQFDFDLGIGLGDAFYLRGLGLDTRADGALRVRSEGRGVIRATGSVEARDGTYEGFGQKLAIQRGRVNFVGSLENPGLDVLALRTGLPVEVGVSITRTAADPLIRLHSDPAMADVEVLSWLVLGRPAELGAADNVALARAAAGLLSGTGEGIPAQLARTLGIDEISLRAGDLGAPGSILPRQTVAGATRGDARLPTTVGTEIIVVGKRLSDAVTISYEQALSGAANSVLISYRLTERLSLVARSGTDTALELVYSFAFD